MPTPKQHPYKRLLMGCACLAAVLWLGVGLIEIGPVKFGPVGTAGAGLAAGPAPGSAANRLITLNFPPVPVAVLELGGTAPDGHGGSTWQVQKVMARGKVQIPANASIMLHLRYEGLEHIQTLAQLNHAQVQQLQITSLDLDDSQFAFFKIFPNICRLNLDSTLVTDKSLATMASFKKLFDLRLSKVSISGEGLEALDGLPLHSLNFSGSCLKEGNLAKIKSLPATLLSLNCSATHIANSDLVFLGKCQKLESLDLSRNKPLDDNCIRSIARLPHLANLLIADTAITDASLPTLAKMAGLKRLVVRPRTFWKKGSGKSPRPDLTIVDATDDSRTPIDVFGPLH